MRHSPDVILDEIRRLDPEIDHERIVFLSTCYAFPFDTTRALEFALFRTFCIPAVSALLDKTGEFQKRPQKRYDDTDLIISELLEYGYQSERGCRALRHLNQIHHRFNIANEDYLYVLSTFVFEPIRWNTRFGWRPMCDQERLGMFHFWHQVGCRMNIRHIPVNYDAIEQFNIEYEKSHIRYTQANHRVAVITRDLFVGWFPILMAPIVRMAIYALLDDPTRKAFGFPRPSWWMRGLVICGLTCRARMLRWLPQRRQPRLRTEMKHRTYPRGYSIEQLGPPSTPSEDKQI